MAITCHLVRARGASRSQVSSSKRGSNWVQLTLQGADPHSVAVRIAPPDTAAEVVGALLSWLKDPAKPTSQVLHFD